MVSCLPRLTFLVVNIERLAVAIIFLCECLIVIMMILSLLISYVAITMIARHIAKRQSIKPDFYYSQG